MISSKVPPPYSEDNSHIGTITKIAKQPRISSENVSQIIARVFNDFFNLFECLCLFDIAPGWVLFVVATGRRGGMQRHPVGLPLMYLRGLGAQTAQTEHQEQES
jgi:hypothetical protein